MVTTGLLTYLKQHMRSSTEHIDWTSYQPFERHNRSLFLVSLFLFGMWAAILTVKHPKGCDYFIHNYFASLFLNGTNPYNAPEVSLKPGSDCVSSEAYKQPFYLDYSGFQLAVYVGCKYVTTAFHVDGFIIYPLGLLLMALIAAYLLLNRRVVSSAEYSYFVVLCLVAPGLGYFNFVSCYSDKLLYLAMPLVLLWVYSRHALAAFFLVGAFTGWSGIAISIAPLFLMDAARKPYHAAKPWRAVPPTVPCLIALVIGSAISFAPFFPDSLLGWERRAMLDRAGPVWYSLWILIPGAYIVPHVDKLAMIAAWAIIWLCAWRNRIDLKAGVILALSVYFFFSMSSDPWRIAPQVVLMVFVFKRHLWRQIYFWFAFAFLNAAVLVMPFYLMPPGPSTSGIGATFLAAPMMLAYTLVIVDNLLPGNKRETD